MIDPSNTQLIAKDLKELYVELNSSRRFPKKFRLLFEHYISKSQQLTETMRKEYKKFTGKKWVASSFQGWSTYTDILKALRNATYHGSPLIFSEVTLAVYPLIEFYTDRRPIEEGWIKKGYRAKKSISFIDAPFIEKYTSCMPGYPRKVNIVEDSTDIRNYVFPLKEFASYEVKWTIVDENLRKFTDETKTIDVVILILKSYPVLKKYIEFYDSQLDLNRLI